MSRLNERLLEEFEQKESIGIELSDSLDVKASIVLLLATFLATEIAYLSDKHPAGTAFLLEISAAISLTLSLVAAVVALWPRTYIYPDPESTSSRLSQLENIFDEFEGLNANALETEANVMDQLTMDQIGWCRARIKNNQSKNRIKSWWLNASFYATTAALGAILAALALLSHLFSGIPR